MPAAPPLDSLFFGIICNPTGLHGGSRAAAAGSGSIGSNNVEIVSNDHVDKFHVFKITFRCYDYADSDYSAVLSAI